MERLYFSMQEVDQLNMNQLELVFIQRIIVIGKGLFFVKRVNAYGNVHFEYKKFVKELLHVVVFA